MPPDIAAGELRPRFKPFAVLPNRGGALAA
jgi:hypothetical protein